jgi:hypothetical protein
MPIAFASLFLFFYSFFEKIASNVWPIQKIAIPLQRFSRESIQKQRPVP